MPKFRLDSIGQLAGEMRFTPHDARGAQVAAAEELLHTIEPGKAYPLDFVIFRVTGYHPRQVSEGLLTGIALQHDVGLLIELVSDTLDMRTDSLAEPVLSIDDVTEKFNVSSKTIQRWRRKGLPARRFVFGDGKRRVGFLLSSVERFLAAHSEQVARGGANFSPLTDDQLDEILRRARRLAGADGGCCAAEISRRIARRVNRSPLTVLHTIRKHDAEHPDCSVFTGATTAAEISPDERARILRAYKRGLPVRKLARRAGRPKSAIYRVVLDERIDRVSRRKARFIDDPLYHQPDAESVIEAIVASAQDASIEPAGTHEPDVSRRVPRDLPAYLQALYRTPLLAPARERALFLKLNLHNFQFAHARRRLDPQLARSRDLNRLESLMRRATEVKNLIVRANLRLVVAVARKHLRPGLSLMELISDGNLTLMRAVDGFDVHRGNRFSTYATLALMKGFARSVPQMQAQARRSALGGANGPGALDHDRLAEVPDARLLPVHDRFVQRDEIRRLLDQLDDRERRVLQAHYGLGDHAPATHEEVAERMGLSKQRVRQIKQGALAKLRALALAHS